VVRVIDFYFLPGKQFPGSLEKLIARFDTIAVDKAAAAVMSNR
jgi:hypothetical protein